MSIDTSAISPKHLSYVQAAYLLTSTDRSKQLMARILFWAPMATIERRDRKWVAKSTDEWAAETGLSHRQVRKALKDLRDAHLIVTGQYIFGGRNTLHTALSSTGVAVVGLFRGAFNHKNTFTALPPEERKGLRGQLTKLLARPHPPGMGELQNCFSTLTVPDAPYGSPPDAPQGSPPDAPYGSPLYTVDLNETAEDSVYASSKQDAPTETDTPNVEDTLKGMFQSQETPEKAPSKTPRQHFMQWWRFWWHTQYCSQIGPFTSVEMGKVRHLLKKLGMENCSEVQAGAFVEVLFKHWPAIKEAVQDQKGYKSVPTRPDLNFVLVNAYIVRDAVAAQSGKKGAEATPTPSKNQLRASTGLLKPPRGPPLWPRRVQR